MSEAHGNMTETRQREIVIEYEHVQLIRKRAKTELAHCSECGGDGDFVHLKQAAELFGTPENELFDFIQNNYCHYRAGFEAKIQLCLASLLACMKAKTLNNQIKMIGD